MTKRSGTTLRASSIATCVDARRLGRIRIQKRVDDSLPDGRVPGSVRQMLAETTNPTNDQSD
jgi:hypothetical protein